MIEIEEDIPGRLASPSLKSDNDVSQHQIGAERWLDNQSETGRVEKRPANNVEISRYEIIPDQSIANRFFRCSRAGFERLQY